MKSSFFYKPNNQLRALQNIITFPSQIVLAANHYLPLLLQTTEDISKSSISTKVTLIFTNEATLQYRKWFWLDAFGKGKAVHSNQTKVLPNQERLIKLACVSLKRHLLALERKKTSQTEKELKANIYNTSFFDETMPSGLHELLLALYNNKPIATAHQNSYMVSNNSLKKPNAKKKLDTKKNKIINTLVQKVDLATSSQYIHQTLKFSKAEHLLMTDLAAKTEMGFLLLYGALQTGLPLHALANTVSNTIHSQMNMQGISCQSNTVVLVTTTSKAKKTSFKKKAPQTYFSNLQERLEPNVQININSNSNAGGMSYCRNRSILYGQKFPKEVSNRFFALNQNIKQRLGLLTDNDKIIKKDANTRSQKSSKTLNDTNTALNTSLSKLLSSDKHFNVFIKPIFPLSASLVNEIFQPSQPAFKEEPGWQYAPLWFSKWKEYHAISELDPALPEIDEIYLNLSLSEKRTISTNKNMPIGTGMPMEVGCCILIKKKKPSNQSTTKMQKATTNHFFKLVGTPAFGMLNFNSKEH